MIALILAHPHIFWLSLGGLLLAAEMLGGNGYLLWSGIAGVVTGLLVWMLPLSWEWQGTLFAVLTLLAAWLWSRWLRNRVKRQKPADAQLNQRGQQLLGRRFTLETALVNGRGRSLPMKTSRRAARLKWSPLRGLPCGSGSSPPGVKPALCGDSSPKDYR